jgi:2-polyprenyl-3-methyl-5-hydroxy-6-metoxy-1,4-benzoquinol methylase
LLDIGCDTGAFALCAAQETGVEPVGIDVARLAVVAARQSGLEAYHTTIENAPVELRDFEVVTAIDVVEHVPDPLEFLNAIRARMRACGAVYIETPNIKSTVYRLGALLCKVTGGRPAATWHRLFPPQHLQYFTTTSFVETARRAGFTVAGLVTRTLPHNDLATSQTVRAAMDVMQLADDMAGERILICAVLENA